jgi:hypothetical protein
VLLAFSALFASPATAFSVFDDRSAWEAAVAGATIVTDSFDTNIPGASQITFDSGVVSTNAGGRLYTFDNSVSFGYYANGLDALGMYGSISNTWTFPEPVIGFGADWSAVLSYTDFTVIGDFDGTGPQSLNISAAIGGRYVPQFLGIVGLSDFDEVRFVSSETQNYFADHLSFAVAGAPIPEPTAALCFAVGFVVLSAALQRPHGTTD